MPGVFISYRNIARSWAPMYIDWVLGQRFGRDHMFEAGRSILAGTNIPTSILRWIEQCSVLVVLIDPPWLSDLDKLRDDGDWVRREIVHARVRGKTLLPVLLDGAEMPSGRDLPPDVAPLTKEIAVRMRTRTASADVQRLIGEIERLAPDLVLASLTDPVRPAPATPAAYARAEHEVFRPRAIVLTGIAGALHDDLAIGDILVATKVYAYHSGTVRPDGFIPRPRSWETPHHLDQTARHVHHAGTYRSLLPPGRSPQVSFRPIASGEMVVDTRDHDLARQLRSAYDDAAAVEMEGAGAAHSGHLNGTPVIIVRAISDLADGAKLAADRQGWQPLAAANAAAFAVALAADLTTADPAAFGTAPQPPSQLPAHGAPLFGRQGHLAELDDILLTSAAAHPRIAILTGMAGAGKTALAVDWAYRAAEAFPDGLLYIDARGFGPDPALQAGELLAILLRALGQTRGAEHGTVGERAARLRSALHDRRVLILLDNIGSVVQIRPLLPGGHTCALLITSRERLRGLTVQYGVRSVDVGPLPSSDAVELLHTAIGARAAEDPDGPARLAARCAGLPLALRIAAERITSMPAQDLDSVADQLGGGTALDLFDTGDDPYSAVRTVFSWSYQALSEPSATAFRLLSLHPAKTFALPAAAAQIGVPAARAAVILRGLVNAHVVTEPAVNSYEMHDLVWAHARELCARIDDDRTQTAAVRRGSRSVIRAATAAAPAGSPSRRRTAISVTPVAGCRPQPHLHRVAQLGERLGQGRRGARPPAC
jgi:nucleoside phosphorylase